MFVRSINTLVLKQFRLQNTPITSPTSSQVFPKKPLDSFSSVTLPLKSDFVTRNEYINFHGAVRLGKFMEDLDLLSGNDLFILATIAYKHCETIVDQQKTFLPVAIVTASVDRIQLNRKMTMDKDIVCYGHVTYVGQSSMEVSIVVEEGGETEPKLVPLELHEKSILFAKVIDCLILVYYGWEKP
jgi:acyl-coenzyme A thioesterase 9